MANQMSPSGPFRTSATGWVWAILAEAQNLGFAWLLFWPYCSKYFSSHVEECQRIVGIGVTVWLIWLTNRGPWFTCWFNQLPGPPKQTPMGMCFFGQDHASFTPVLSQLLQLGQALTPDMAARHMKDANPQRLQKMRSKWCFGVLLMLSRQ